MMGREKITPRVIGARKAVALYMRGTQMSWDELTMALETLTAAGVFEEIDSAIDRAVTPAEKVRALSPRRRLGPRGSSTDSFLLD